MRPRALLWGKKIGIVSLGLWGSFLLMGAAVEYSEGEISSGHLVAIAGVMTIAGACLAWPSARLRLGGWSGLIAGALVIGGFVVFIVFIAQSS